MRLRNRRNIINISGPGHSRPYLTWKIFRLNGVKELRGHDQQLTYHHENVTQTEKVIMDAINGKCTDIRKSTVSRIFSQVFGYTLDVDPTTYYGPIVRKSEENATHDGVIINGPTASVDESNVYQKLIDNSFDNDHVLDIRPCVIGSEIPFC
jgi:hypothetical protein